MKINIVLPVPSPTPIGGYKVQYEYANHMAQSGHRVTVVHPYTMTPLGLPAWRWYLVALARLGTGRIRLVPWYDFDSRVRLVYIPTLHPYLLPPADTTVLTAWQTSERIHTRTLLTGPLFQVVYDYEFWEGADDPTRRRIECALRWADVHHIATSSAVRSMLAAMDVEPVGTVTAGLDTTLFSRTTPSSERADVVGFPLRGEAHKGTDVALAAVDEIRQRRPATTFIAFGRAWNRPLPEGVVSHGQVSDAELRDFYNRCAVFVLPSYLEGWGLPAAEAMACGAALVTTANGGVEDFAVDDVNARVVPPGEPSALADAVLSLLQDRTSRLRLADAGYETARAMSWETSAAELLNVIARRF